MQVARGGIHLIPRLEARNANHPSLSTNILFRPFRILRVDMRMRHAIEGVRESAGVVNHHIRRIDIREATHSLTIPQIALVRTNIDFPIGNTRLLRFNELALHILNKFRLREPMPRPFALLLRRHPKTEPTPARRLYTLAKLRELLSSRPFQ